MIYLDYAAATPLDEQVYRLMQPFFADSFYNPSASYLAAVSVKKSIETARNKIAHYLGCRGTEITFTAGATEGNNLAIKGVMEMFPKSNLVVSNIEHKSVLEPAEQFELKKVKVDKAGIVVLDDLLAKIDDSTVLVSIMYANNEIGSIQPLTKISAALETIRKKRRLAGNTLPLYLHTDAAQAVNYLDLHTSRLGIDLMTINGGKIYGPKQSGALFIKSGIAIRPQILGGGQERGIRSGTENVSGVVGLGEALNITQTMRENEVRRLTKLQDQFIDLLEKKIPGVIINGSRKSRLPNNVHITLPGMDNERLLFALDEHGICCALGSACSASDEEPSHVLKAIGISDANAASSLRFTMGRSTKSKDVVKTVDILSGLIA